MSDQYLFDQYAKRFLEQERNPIRINHGAPVRVALVYPNHYRVGMASLGFQTVYRILNEHPSIQCERAFVYDPPFNCTVRTLESGTKLDQFDLIGFSLSFETDIAHVIDILKNSNSPLLSRYRSKDDPIIMIGGVVSGLNPSPLLPFLDGLLVGEGEGILNEMADTFSHLIQTGASRDEKMKALSELTYLYFPRFSSLTSRHILTPLKKYPAYTPVITPLSHFRNMFVVEVARGCKRGCRFCAARQIYAPYRSHSVESILETIRTKNQGSQRIGLEGAGLSDYSHLEHLCDALIQEGYQISFSSIRPDRITPALIKSIQGSGTRSFTIAPEAGTEQLRKRMGKPISNKTLFKAVKLLETTSIQTLKLYYLIGCPGETDEDIRQMVVLTKQLAALFRIRTKKRIVRMSINAFIPKPFTVLQWAPMDTEKELRRKRKLIRKELGKEKGIVLVPKSTKEEILQGALSLGDERVGLAVMESVEKGVPWKTSFREREIDLDRLLHRQRLETTKLPWDFIPYPVPRKQLWDQYQKINQT